MRIHRNGIHLLGKTFSGLLISPARFFAHEANGTHWGFSLGLLTFSAIASAAILLMMKHSPFTWINGGLWILNAVCMAAIAAAFGFLAARIIQAEHIPFSHILRIYAFAGSMPTLVAWVPGSFWITELWRWWLVGIGLTYSTRLNWRQTTGVITCSIGLTILFFWSLMLAM